MSIDDQKLDIGMSEAFRAWRQNPDLAPDAGVSVSLSFTGGLAPIEALGFETHAVFGDQAVGVVYFRDVPTLTAYPGVLSIFAGQSPKFDLDTAVQDMRARATAPISGSPIDGVWHAEIATGALTHIPKGTGKGVIVAIIDSGIDYTHPMFMSQTTPTKKTRILRIWDQGLIPATLAECPPPRLLASSNTYGVEYDSSKIEAALNGGTDIAHRDYNGHGTHVAGIAAGGTRFAWLVGDASKVGVAPEADIMVVKFMDVPRKIYIRLPDGSVGQEVFSSPRFKDAVLYCLRTARELNRPVVINMSFGNPSYPGDGLDEHARFLDLLLDPAQAPGDSNFPKGAIITKAAGNYGIRNELVGRITVPASGEIIVPFVLTDGRGGSQTTRHNGRRVRFHPDVGASFWYRRPTAPITVKFAVRLPFGPGGFSADVGAGDKLELGIKPVVGPPPNDIAVPLAPDVQDIHRLTIDHKYINPPVSHPAGGTVQRQYVRVSVSPKLSGGTISYHSGVYEVRIKAPPSTVIFVMGEREFWDGPLAQVSFRMSEKMRNLAPGVEGSSRSPQIQNISESSIFDSGGKQVITVASYCVRADPSLDDNASDFDHGISPSSSRGPLRDYSDPPLGPICPKPDIAAPGYRINSAESRHSEEGIVLWPWWYWGDRFQATSGTSMAAPAIAGLVALMLEKNPNLNTTQVRTALSSAPRAAVAPSTPPDSTNAYGAGMVDAMTSHANTP
jgi:subtilisin family serine protease